MPTDPIVQKTIAIHAPSSVIWEYLTHPDLMPLWMSENKIEIFSEWKTGSFISIHGKMEHFEYQSKGTILTFDREKRFQYTYWNNISRTPDLPENYSILDFRLEETSTETILSFTQSNFVGEATYEHASFYWNTALEVLKKAIENTQK